GVVGRVLEKRRVCGSREDGADIDIGTNILLTQGVAQPAHAVLGDVVSAAIGNAAQRHLRGDIYQHASSLLLELAQGGARAVDVAKQIRLQKLPEVLTRGVYKARVQTHS